MKKSLARRETAALHIAAGRTVAVAARQAGVSTRAVVYWLKEEGFKARVEALQGELFNRAVRRLTALSTRAVKRLRALLDSANEAVSLGACRTVLDRAADLGRLQALEARVQELEGKRHAVPGAFGASRLPHRVHANGGGGGSAGRAGDLVPDRGGVGAGSGGP